MEEFGKHLRRRGKKEHVVAGLIAQVEQFKQFLADTRGVAVDAADCADLDAYAEQAERQRKGKARIAVRGVALYYRWAGREELASCAHAIREAGIARTRRSLSLRQFVGLVEADLERLAAEGIVNVEQMLAAGSTAAARQALSERTGVSSEAILDLVKLADLARIPGVAGIRARLYYDAGVDTVTDLATWEPEALRQMLVDYVERTRFAGIAPLPKEVDFTIAAARTLPQLVEW
jgi:hypothetical protein